MPLCASPSGIREPEFLTDSASCARPNRQGSVFALTSWTAELTHTKLAKHFVATATARTYPVSGLNWEKHL